MVRYARHPLFVIEFVLCWFTSVAHIDKQMHEIVSPISCTAVIGRFGLLVLNGLTRTGSPLATVIHPRPALWRVNRWGVRKAPYFRDRRQESVRIVATTLAQRFTRFRTARSRTESG